jgi:HEAT repeat protein
VRSAASLSLAQAAQANPQELLEPLLSSIEDKDDSVRSASISALGDMVTMEPNLADYIFQPLLKALHDSEGIVRNSAAEAMNQVIQANPKLAGRALQPMLIALKDTDSWVRQNVASVLQQMAQTGLGLSRQMLSPLLMTLKDSNIDVRNAATAALADIVFNLTINEIKNKRDPVQFLFDHFEGRKSFLPDINANTNHAYREIFIHAMARWLDSEKPETKAMKEALRQKLEWTRDHDQYEPLRTAAADVFVEAARLKEARRAPPG